ncbi:MAG: UvrD-helicase domain-containing protein, partial [Methylophilaceae bacterium]|nr:UvrD-helicase domain-containing protein [Methylophilaceae bacterium]
MSKRIPTDQLQREMAIGAGSFIVEAPAGSGKTSILIKRFLHLLLKVDEPTDVIAITFTNKAAMEMRLRIEEALIKKNDEERELIEAIWQRAKKLGWSLRFNEDLRIMTIDKLATQIVNQTSIFENLGRNYYTDENPEEIYIQSIKEVVNESQYIKTLLKNQNNDTSKIIQQLVDAIKKRGQWLPRLLKFKDKNMAELSQDYSNYSRSEIKEILNKIGQNFNSNEKNEIFGFVDEIHSSTKHAEEWQTWLAFAKIIFTSNNDIRKKFDIRQGISNDENGKKLKVKIKNFLNKNIHKINVLKLIFKVDYLNKYDHFLPLVPDLLLILVATCEKLNGKFLAQKIHDFEQIMINANQALEQTNLAEILDMNIEHILVNEFQDINYSQL